MPQSHRIPLLTLVTGLALSLACAVAGSAAAKPKIYKSVPTHVSFSATKDSSGAVIVEAIFRSPDPRCLEGKRFLHKRASGNYPVAGGSLYFGGPFTAAERFSGKTISEPFGYEGSASGLYLPDQGLMAPVSAPGRSPYVWRATWPAATTVFITNPYDKDLPWHYSTTVSAATGVKLGAVARASGGQGLSYYKVAFNQKGKRVIVKCGTLADEEARAEIGL